MDPLSKTQKKRDALALQGLGEALVRLSVGQLKTIDMPGKMLDAVVLAKKLTKHTALNRQLQFIGVLMRKCDTAPIREALRIIERGGGGK